MQERQRSNTLLQVMGVFVGISGCFSVLFGAWLAHAGQLLPASTQSSMATALQYQFLHTLALLALVVLMGMKRPSKFMITACIAFVLGILCFCVTIYIKSFFDIHLLGKLTPFGGISFAVAWLMLAFEGKNNL